ncbi:type IV secretion system protein [Rhodanobacter sp. L36]|uniref:type IV secretion system protein n=1 Tax=Rhodanobacter sp. L36 TaxID=1747221 RepID=UPI00131E493B|nr:type IV secretion system protein [Rhodanobacter sp. L36]
MLVFYVLVYKYIQHEIDKFLTALQTQVIGVASGVALILVTIWILIQGYRIVTGQSRDSMMAHVTNSMRVVFIVSFATTLGIFGTDLHTLFTSTLQNDINQVFTGQTCDTSNDTNCISQAIDDNLTKTAFAMAAIDAVQSAPGDNDTAAGKARASDFAIFGTASPPMAAGAMLLMFNLAIALFVGLGPIFILCLLFEQTKPLFNKWLMYGIGTLFGMGMLSFVSSVVLKVTASVAEALWASTFINSLVGTTSEGLTTQSMEQGGIGLLMTMLIISAPPMAAQFFNGTLGSFMAYSAFNGAGARPGPQGQPAGSYAGGGGGYRPAPQGNVAPSVSPTQSSGGFNHPNLGQAQKGAATDLGVRANTQYGNAPTAPPSAGN